MSTIASHRSTVAASARFGQTRTPTRSDAAIAIVAETTAARSSLFFTSHQSQITTNHQSHPLHWWCKVFCFPSPVNRRQLWWLVFGTLLLQFAIGDSFFVTQPVFVFPLRIKLKDRRP